MSFKKFNRWTPEEETQLVGEISSLIPIETIAENHKRSVNAIRIRLKENILPKITDEEQKTFISTTYKLEEITLYQQKQPVPPVVHQVKGGVLASVNDDFPFEEATSSTNNDELRIRVEILEKTVLELMAIIKTMQK